MFSSVMRQYKKRPKHVLDAAAKKVDELFEQAREGHSTRRVNAARRVGMKVQMPIGHEIEYCRKCNQLLSLGNNATIRVRDGRRILRCNCGHIRKK